MMYGNVGKVKTFNKLGIQACINGNFKKGLKYFETSSRNMQNVNEAFDKMIKPQGRMLLLSAVV